MTVAHALALLPRQASYVLQDHEPMADAAALGAVARWSLRLAPAAEADPPDSLLLDVTGCGRMYGGEAALRRHVIQMMQRMGLTVRVAIAPCIGGAWALARFGEAGSMIVSDDDLPAALAPLPVAALRLEASVIAELAEVGIDRVDQLLDVPRDEVASRFGVEGAKRGTKAQREANGVLRRVDQALGRLPEPLAPVVEEDSPRVERAFAGPTTRWEAVEAAAHGLVGELAEELLAREAGARRLVLEVERLDRELRPEVHREALTFSRPSRDGRYLWALLRPRVERLHLGHGVERVALRADRVGRLRHEQGSWDAEADELGERAEEAVGQLVDLLQARLGPGGVLRGRGVDTHVPEAAFALHPVHEPAGSSRPVTRADDEAPYDPGDRPPHLLPRPEPAQVTLLQPEGPLVSVRWRGEHRITCSLGPQRIARRWWRIAPPQPPPDAPPEAEYQKDTNREYTLSCQGPAARDYYKAQDDAGLWIWLYRNLLTGRWFVQGTW